LTAKRRHLTRKATISDVAARAGVSIKTVSRVLNREPKVRASTRARVEESMQVLRYRPNSPGRMLASRRSYILGLVYNANSSYINSIQNGALDLCRREHYDLLIHPCNYRDPSVAEEIADLVATGKVDGLILVPPISDSPRVRARLREVDAPHVCISRAASQPGDLAVNTNDREACAQMTARLVELGHRKIGFVRGHPDHKAMASRYQGFLDGMRRAGLKVAPEHVAQGDNTFDSGRACAATLLERPAPPSAVFCANDHMAAGLMAGAHERGIDIPGTLSIAGFDDIPLASQVWPALTTIRQPLREMASRAAELLILRLRGRSTDPQGAALPATLVLRTSTGPVHTGAARTNDASLAKAL
jgi:LacI family transcriptional regulator, galactose operon repressor